MLARTACLEVRCNEENSFKWSNEWIIHLLIVIFIIVNFSKLEPWKKVSTDYFNAISNDNKECRISFVSAPLPSYTFQFPEPADPRRVVEVYFFSLHHLKKSLPFWRISDKSERSVKTKIAKGDSIHRGRLSIWEWPWLKQVWWSIQGQNLGQVIHFHQVGCYI